MHDKRVVPYDTGKVQIGVLYTPPPPAMDEFDEQIQEGLLGIRSWRIQFLRNVFLYICACLLAAFLYLIIVFVGGNGHA